MSCIYAGSSSGGAEDPYVCCVVGGEDGCDGEEEKVMAILYARERECGIGGSTMPDHVVSCGHQLNMAISEAMRLSTLAICTKA